MSWGLSAAFGLIMVAVTATIAIRDHKWIGGAVVLGILGALALSDAASARRTARAAFMVTNREVIVRNPWQTKTFPIAEVSRFAPRYPMPGVVVELKDGRLYPIWTLSQEGPRWKAKQRREEWAVVADQLNALLHE